MKLLDVALMIINTLEFVLGHAHKNEVELMLRTVLTESAFFRNGKLYFHRKQLGGGPARSIFQIEPTTARDILTNYLAARKPNILSKVKTLAGTDDSSFFKKLEQNRGKNSRLRLESGDFPHLSAIINDIDSYLLHNQPFACAIARCVYLRVPKAIPVTPQEQNAYYKQYYNTYKGKGSAQKCEQAFRQFGGYEVINNLYKK